ncbi:hypothetical protein FO519_002781 [Halicephalobus sp. NKZ332]|nr:hypothetical protein FO519_002781 [Halicephalobus sp. NKZ332]
MSEKSALLNSIATELVNLDEQFKELESVFNDFVLTNVGKTCLVVGPPLSGKTSLIKAVTKKFETEILEKSTKTIDGRFCDDSDGTDLLKDIDKNERTLLIVDNFEEFAMRSRQQLLYTIMNQACSSRCLVILTSRDMTCVERFEKRVRSRMSQKKINLQSESTVPPVQALLRFLVPESWKNEKKTSVAAGRWKVRCNMIESTGFVARELERLTMFSVGSGFYRLKQLALMLVASLYEKEVGNFNNNIVEFIQFVSPNTKTIEQYLKLFEIQELFILEIIRRLSERMGDRDIHQVNIYRTFHRLFKGTNRKQRSKRVVYWLLQNLRMKRIIDFRPGSDKVQPDFKSVHLVVSDSLVKKVWIETSRKTFLADVFLNYQI